MKRLRWVGRVLVYAGDGVARVHYADVGSPGWYWTAGSPEHGIPGRSMPMMLLATELEAKAAALEYVQRYLRPAQ